MSKLLLSIVVIFGLGVVTACDDPEVQDKVESILLHGAVQAQAYCKTDSTFSQCSGQLVSHANFRAHLFQDGSSLLQTYIPYTNNSDTPQLIQYNSTGESITAVHMLPNGSHLWQAEVVGGEFVVDGICTGLGNTPFTENLDIDSDMTCTGFNLEAFGITP
jgi:hypothetical protein